MEVCGGHTLAIRKYGIQHLLPDTIELLSVRVARYALPIARH